MAARNASAVRLSISEPYIFTSAKLTAAKSLHARSLHDDMYFAATIVAGFSGWVCENRQIAFHLEKNKIRFSISAGAHFRLSPLALGIYR
ncbi:MAG: hypothetical protein KGK16_17765 [Bradyrhizobium sp.]|uniref:hypothetical protein n=1 Tax=Bradyrhizobium sp. TaxID=376 RepID=UPI002387E2D7|nr:hypothetical protein [Bradyrhizobium sp.]MDE2332612.1 hypothetical protein [Bradyrhizobium sp.]MDE2603146.1 hypothetical protein [Bradyrhizobium sp.]